MTETFELRSAIRSSCVDLFITAARRGLAVAAPAVFFLATPLCLYAITPGEPFMQGATMSIDDGAPTPLTLPSGPPQKASAYAPGGSATGMAEDQTGCIPEPVPSSISDWNVFYHVPWGIEIARGWKDFVFGDPPHVATTDDVLRHVEATFATINAVFKRDVGAVIQVRHVVFLIK